MNRYLLILFVLTCSFSLAQKNLDVYDYTYDIESCGDELEHAGRVSAMEILQDTTIFKLEVAYKNCHLFDQLSIKQKGETLYFNFKKIEDLLCWCDGVSKYYFTIKTVSFSNIPTKFIISKKGTHVMDLVYGDLTFKKKFLPKYMTLDGVRYNYTNEHGKKEGTWLVSNDSTNWNYSKIEYYEDGEIIGQSDQNFKGVSIQDSILTFYEGNRLSYKTEMDSGTEIQYYYSGGNTVDIFDPRFDKKSHDKVFLQKEYNSEGEIRKECFHYIKGKRIVKTACK